MQELSYHLGFWEFIYIIYKDFTAYRGSNRTTIVTNFIKFVLFYKF